ncbi:PNK3P-domain-containing protein [Stereum hirsutum FP-91666 SS1]|uniref:PNK3P-domain-containing protein n=1 Tax=Stereum hirsutum (strain FP-91666) TaxID=721885 RepID=UPI000440EB13|nr:PNK3P-domain-containing protein [Stereum hirsutum FP-91666 SS1]EIM90535.1 PNK3P-domain-containing protein [Stereum hirsutum FP-91666 SS1]
MRRVRKRRLNVGPYSSTEVNADRRVASDLNRTPCPTVFPIFLKEPTEKSSLQWVKPSLGPHRTCLYGINLEPSNHVKVAVFDLDGTVIKSSYGKGKTSVGPTEFIWWKEGVPKKLTAVSQAGYSLVFITNQAGLKGPKQVDEWKRKMSKFSVALPDVPFRIFAATAKDGFRKPIPGMWYELERIFKESGVEIDKSQSYYVGDGAGRPTDFACTDRKFAINVGVRFYTPEEFFIKAAPAAYNLPGFHVSSLKQPSTKPADAPPIIPPGSPPQEVVVFVGYPALGKSTFFKRHFLPLGYVHVNQDTLKTRDKCVKAVQEALSAGKSCVVDNTNRDVMTRKFYVDIAKKYKVPIRCFHFEGSQGLAWHNNLYRAFNRPPSSVIGEPARDLLPKFAFATYEKGFEEPTMEEGFDEIQKVQWQFEGSEEERQRWSMWLQIDGK